MTSNYIGGRNAVVESLKNPRLAVESLYLVDSASGTRIDEAKAEASNRSIPVRSATEAELDQLTGGNNHQGIVLEISDIHPYELADLLERPSTQEYRRLFILDEIQDPVNLGKLSRIALFFGFDGIVKTRDRSAPINSTVIETSAGAAARLPIAQVKNLRRALETLKDERFWLIGTAPGEEKSIEDVPVDRNLAIMLGHEGSGLRRLTKEEADYLVSIPGAGGFDSLNVATAGAISAYALKPDEP